VPATGRICGSAKACLYTGFVKLGPASVAVAVGLGAVGLAAFVVVDITFAVADTVGVTAAAAGAQAFSNKRISAEKIHTSE
jgi:hypothetical protein